VPSPSTPQPTVSSLHATSLPPAQAPCRTYSTVSKFVVPPHVWIVDTPDTPGVHWNTASGDVFVVAHVPARLLAPAVTPVNTPPAAGITTGAPHVAPGSVLVVDVVVLVLVVLLVLLVVDVLLVVVLLVVEVGGNVELVVGVLVDVVVVLVLLVVEVVAIVDVVVVEPPVGAATFRLNAPLAPP